MKKETNLYRIINGYLLITIDGQIYKLIPPTIETRYIAERAYDQAFEDNKFSDWITPEKCLELLISNGFVSADIEENLEKIQERIEDLKVKLYESALNPGKQGEIKRTLSMVKEKYVDMLNKRHMFDYLTIEGFAGMVKRQYIIYDTLYYFETNIKVWDSFDDIDTRLMEKVIYHLNKDILDISEIREIARTEPWRGYWNSNKVDPFGKPAIFYTDEQKTLVLFSKMYDSAYEHPKCPPDDIVNNDDMFDGWMIKQRREREKERMTGEVEKNFNLKGKNQKADELFIIPRDENNQPSTKKEDIRKINDLNDFQGKMIKAQRNALIKNKGSATDSQFADRRVEIQSERNRMFMEQVKGGKRGK